MNLKSILAKLAEHPIEEIQKAGWHFQRNDYYSPLNDIQFLRDNPDLWGRPLSAAGIEWRLDDQLKVAEKFSRYVEELRDIPEESAVAGRFLWQNGMWNNMDAVVQYGLVRDVKPKRYVEIGCGWSSLLLRDALTKNDCETEVTLIEPYPNPYIFPHLPAAWERVPSMLQKAPLEAFQKLEAGDVLFYDGSHCAKTASDVNTFFFNILPLVKPGVIIHLHDVFFPNDYPASWMIERGQTWNEQYLLQAFLMHNEAYRILICNSYLAHYKQAELQALFRGIQPLTGGSFWMQKIAE
ncbi:MAG: class I SAM-dependent methyltransferase [Opitutales bacterium]|nr:class I SAM-dependent methyltransferase [Opitutales bacterium]